MSRISAPLSLVIDARIVAHVVLIPANHVSIESGLKYHIQNPTEFFILALAHDPA